MCIHANIVLDFDMIFGAKRMALQPTLTKCANNKNSVLGCSCNCFLSVLLWEQFKSKKSFFFVLNYSIIYYILLRIFLGYIQQHTISKKFTAQ